MRKKVILITGAAGEIGQELLRHLGGQADTELLSLDVQPLPEELDGRARHNVGSILDDDLLARLVSQYEIDIIFHLAALLSKRSEFTPGTAHRVNVDGTLKLLELAAQQSQWRRQAVQFIFPSSIAVYGLPNLAAKQAAGAVAEREWNMPRTMYGANKLYCEHMGRYFANYYQQLAADTPVMLDFRSARYPGLISAFTVPSGGTSDFGPEMIHAAARGVPYDCFVREDATIPFMTMRDAVQALLTLSAAPRERLDSLIYNVTSFSVSAGEMRDRVLGAFPDAVIRFAPDPKRQAIIDSWPAALDDSAARGEWGWRPQDDFGRAFDDYLIPNIARRYG